MPHRDAFEVSTIGIVYAVLMGIFVYRQFAWKRLLPLLVETTALSGAIIFIVGCATGMAWGLTQSGFSQDLAAHDATHPRRRLRLTPEGDTIATPDDKALDALIADAPPMTGAEYLTTEVLIACWTGLDAALRDALAASKCPLQEFLRSFHPVWNLVGRVHFNLAESRRDAEAPFAFLATCTSRVSAHGKAQHLPLSQALAEFSDGKSQARLRFAADAGAARGGAVRIVELLQGRLATAVMERICRPNTGLFPAPKEIKFSCSCPDWASMCKNVAAVLYGVGSRLDSHPELIFALRRVDPKDLVEQAGAGLRRPGQGPATGKVLDHAHLADVFGIEMADAAPAKKPTAPRHASTVTGKKKPHQPTWPPQWQPVRPAGAAARKTGAAKAAVAQKARMAKVAAKKIGNTPSRISKARLAEFLDMESIAQAATRDASTTCQKACIRQIGFSAWSVQIAATTKWHKA